MIGGPADARNRVDEEHAETTRQRFETAHPWFSRPGLTQLLREKRPSRVMIQAFTSQAGAAGTIPQATNFLESVPQ
jgi:hypothetical protein